MVRRADLVCNSLTPQPALPSNSVGYVAELSYSDIAGPTRTGEPCKKNAISQTCAKDCRKQQLQRRIQVLAPTSTFRLSMQLVGVNRGLCLSPFAAIYWHRLGIRIRRPAAPIPGQRSSIAQGSEQTRCPGSSQAIRLHPHCCLSLPVAPGVTNAHKVSDKAKWGNCDREGNLMRDVWATA